MNTLHFYQIEQPTTRQIFDAIINKDYVPMEKIVPKAKQIEVLLKDYFNTNEILVTFDSVTNTGGYPYFFGANESIYELAADINEDFYNLSEEEQNNLVELLSSYTRTYKSLFFN